MESWESREWSLSCRSSGDRRRCEINATPTKPRLAIDGPRVERGPRPVKSGKYCQYTGLESRASGAIGVP